MRRKLLREAALADAGLAREQKDPPPAGERVLEAGNQLRKLVTAPNEHVPRRLFGRPLPHEQVESWVLLEDRLVQLAKRTTGLDSELLHQAGASGLIRLERVSLAARAVQGQHELAAQSLAQRVLAGEALQLADELVMVAQHQIELDPLLERRQPRLFETGDLAWPNDS